MESSRVSFEGHRPAGDFIAFPRTDRRAARDVSAFALLTEAARRWRVVAAVLVPSVLLALLYVVAAPRWYTAEALVEVTGSNGNAVSDVPAAPNYQEAEAVQTQVEAIRAPGVVNQLLATLSPGDRQALLAPSWQVPEAVATVFGIAPAQPASPGEEEQDLREIVGGGLGVEQVGLSAVVSIAFTARDPALAARLANGVVAIATDQARRRAASALSQGLSPIAAQVGVLREQLGREEEDARRFRESNQLYGSQSLAALRAQLAVLNRKLADARSQRLQAQSRSAAAPDGGRPAPGRAGDAVSTVLYSPTITKLRDEASVLSAELQSLTASLGERHPRVREARSRLAEVNRRLAAENATVVRSLRQDSQASRAEEDLLARSIGDLQERIAASAEAEDRAAALDRKAEATEAVYRQLLQRETLLERMGNADLFVTSVRPISAADVPWKKSHPKTALILVLVATIALIAGLLLVIAREQWRQAARRSAVRDRRFAR